MGSFLMALRATLARQAFYTPVLDFAANTYANMLGRQLKKYGLQFEDIYCETPEVLEAVNRISPAEREARSMRIRRAVDLSFKETYLPKEMQDAHQPFQVYLTPAIKQIEKEVWEEKTFERKH